MLKKVFLIIFVFLNFSYAKEYEIKLFLDKNSYDYSTAIINETKSLFPSEDKLNFFVVNCFNNCEKIKDDYNQIKVIKIDKKIKNQKNSSFITYNHIDSIYAKNRLIRTVSLTIYEQFKQKKINSIYIKNKKTKEILSKIEIKKDLLDLKKIFTYIKTNNLDIKLNNNNNKLSYLDIDGAKSSYKPDINIYSNYMQIDKDRAKYSNGQASQKSFESGVKIKQLIYSHNALQNIKIKKLIYKSSKEETKALNDEVKYKATLLYLNIIKAKKHLQVIKIKHKFISQNLEFAKQRVKIGVQDRSDIFRWDSELANSNIELSNSKRELHTLKIQLSNLLEIDNIYDFKEYGLNSTLFKLINKDAIKFLENTKIQNSFLKELVHNHSRLKQLKQIEKAKYEELNMNKSSQYLPTLAFEGSAKTIHSRAGEGSTFQRPWDDEEYQGVINLNLPIYEGGIKSTKIQKNEIELINLKLNYKNTKNIIIENVRKNYTSLSSSYEKIDYARVSEKSSKKNFELIQDKYKNGEENIISLLDAQNAYIVSKLNLNISITEYLSDLSSIYFFSGKIDILVDDNKKQEVENKILKIIKG